MMRLTTTMATETATNSTMSLACFRSTSLRRLYRLKTRKMNAML